MWPLAGAYLAIVLAGVVSLLWGREMRLLRGERLFGLTAVFALGALGSLVTRWGGPTRGGTAFWAVALAGALLVRGRWILIHYDPRAAAAVVEGALAMLLIPWQRSGARYALSLGDPGAVVTVRPIAPGIALLRLTASGGHPKMRLLRALLAKRLRPVFPRPTIDLR